MSFGRTTGRRSPHPGQGFCSAARALLGRTWVHRPSPSPRVRRETRFATTAKPASHAAATSAEPSSSGEIVGGVAAQRCVSPGASSGPTCGGGRRT